MKETICFTYKYTHKSIWGIIMKNFYVYIIGVTEKTFWNSTSIVKKHN